VAVFAGKYETPPTTVWPVLPFKVKAVICLVELNVMVMPSLGAAGIVIVPAANVPAGFITRVCVPAAKV
jgi:hypothetical protein